VAPRLWVGYSTKLSYRPPMHQNILPVKNVIGS